MDVLVDISRTLQVEKLLRERDIAFDVMGYENRSDTQNGHPRVTPIHSNISRRSALIKRDTLDWNEFYPLSKIISWMDELERLYPATCTIISIGKSVEGREIKILKISNSDASNSAVWLDGTIHAREWISTSVVTFIADHIARNFTKLPQHITNKDWYFAPVLNPDGYHYSHTTDRLWRKSRARFGNTVVGVDLNRNFGQYWGRTGCDSTTSSGDPAHNNYRGPEAFSEPETAAVKDLILYSGTPFKIFLTFHAYSEVIAFPWCFTSDACPDYVNLLEGGAIMAKAMYETSGRLYKVGNFKDIMYFASGTSIDWSYGTARIPFTYLIELPSKEHKFLLPNHEILDCCKESLNAVLALADFVDTRKCLNCTVFANKIR